MGWVEKELMAEIAGYAIFLGGVGQYLVAIFELFKGSSFSFAVFGAYGAFWLSWGLVYIEGTTNTGYPSGKQYPNGSAAVLTQWGFLSLCFWVITLRKNICLIVVFTLLWNTFFLLAAANFTGNGEVKKAAGYIGFFTALGALYTGVAELINEEWGRNVLPGLEPIYNPERIPITKQSIKDRTSYEGKTNTMLLHFRGLQIKSIEDVAAIREGVTEAILECKAPDNKVHAVIEYKDVLISDDVYIDYWAMVNEIERKYYLSARRFHVTSFGTREGSETVPATTLKTQAEAAHTAALKDSTHGYAGGNYSSHGAPAKEQAKSVSEHDYTV
jgi:succinate-acetate transporter protein